MEVELERMRRGKGKIKGRRPEEEAAEAAWARSGDGLVAERVGERECEGEQEALVAKLSKCKHKLAK